MDAAQLRAATEHFPLDNISSALKDCSHQHMRFNLMRMNQWPYNSQHALQPACQQLQHEDKGQTKGIHY
jgi:hypothetical protein